MNKLRKSAAMLMLFCLTILIFASTACATKGPDNRLHPNYTWNWPKQGIVMDKKTDAPLKHRRFINGNLVETDVRKDRIYWLDIADSKGVRSWVQVPEKQWIAAEKGKPWQSKL